MTLKELAEFIARTLDSTEDLKTGLQIDVDGEVSTVHMRSVDIARFDFTLGGDLMFKLEISQYPFNSSHYR